MHSYLISSKGKRKSMEYVQDFCKKNKIDPIDASLFSFDKAMGIEDVRDLQKKLFLRPLKSPMKLSVIDAFNGLTTESQNALLKILEEPPNNTIIMLLVPQKEIVLPTIISRCKIVELKENANMSKEEISEYLNILMSFPQKGIGERLKLASDVAKTEEEIFIWLEKMIIVAHQKLPQYFDILKSFQKTYTLLKTTAVNKRFALENLFLSI